MGTSDTPIQYVIVDRLFAFFYWTRFIFIWQQCTVRLYTTPIYLINLLWKLIGLGSGLDLELHYLSIFHGE